MKCRLCGAPGATKEKPACLTCYREMQAEMRKKGGYVGANGAFVVVKVKTSQKAKAKAPRKRASARAKKQSYRRR